MAPSVPAVQWLLIGLGVIVILTGLGVGLKILAIWYRVKRSPRAEMFICQKHGAMLESDCIKFMSQSHCPRCFHENLQAAESLKNSKYL